MKVDRKPKAEKSPPAAKAAKSVRRPAPKTNGKNPSIDSYEYLPVGVVECSPDARYVNVNEEFCRITGYERQELLQLGIKDITHEDDWMFDINLHERLVAGGIPFYKIEKRIKRKDGSNVWVELTRSVVRDPKGKVRYTVGAVLDISDRKHVERVLRESVERLRLATEAAKIFMWEWDFQAQTYTVDDNFEKVLGFSTGLLPKDTAESVQRLIPPEDWQVLDEAVAKAIESHEDLHSLQTRFVNPENGEIAWLELNAKIIYDEAGNLQRMIGVAQNITENKKGEVDLQLARRQAEQSADRTARLQRVTAALSEPLTPLQVAEVVTQQGASALGAVSSSVMLLSGDGQTLEIIYSTSPKSTIHAYNRFPRSLQVPAADAVRSGQFIWLESRQQYLERYPHLTEQINQWGQQAAIALPLSYKESILGVLTLSFDRILPHTVEDEEYVLTLARQCAQAFERAHAEDALRESEERFRALVSQATAGIAQSDMDSRLVFVNPRLCEMLGYSENELLGKTIWELTHTDDLEENKRLFQRMLSSGEPYQFEKRFIRRDGSTWWSNVSVTTIHDSSGRPKGGVGVMIDIEERKRAEEALTEFARQQEALYKLSEQLHRTDSLEDVHDAALDAILSALQCDRASILLYDNTNVMHFVAWRGLSEEYRKATDGHSPWTPDVKDPKPISMDDVRTVDLEESLRAIIQAEGIGALAFIPLVVNEKLIGKFMVYYNEPHNFNEAELDLGLTIAHQLAFGIDRKRTEQALRRERETLTRLFETMPVMVSMIDPETGSMRLNAEFERLIGWKSEEVTVPSLLEALYPHPEYRNEILQRMAASAGKNEWVEAQVQTRDGQTMDSIWSNISVMDDEKLVTGIAIGLDVTERKQTEKRLALLAEVSELLRNMEDPYELLYTISKAIGEHLHVKRVLFNEIDLEHDREIVHRDYHNGLASVAGVHKVSDYSSVTSQEVASGKTVVNADSKTDPRTAQDYEKTYAVSGERSYVVVPMMRENRWVASLWVSDDAPRDWTSEEVSLLETIAERTWTVIEKLRINAELRQSEERFRQAANASGALIYEVDLISGDATVVHGMERLAGYDPQENAMSSDWWHSLIHPDDLPTHLAQLERLLKQAGTDVCEYRVKHRNGDWIIVQDNRLVVRDEAGQSLRLVGAVIDITERKRIEDALRLENERFMQFANSNIVGILIGNTDGDVILANDYYLRLLGVSRQELVEGKVDWKQFTPPEWLPADEKAIQELRERGVCEPYEKEYIRTDGIRVPVYIADAMLPGPGDEIAAFVLDITERKRAEEALRASEERYRAVVESQAEMLCRIRPDGTILFVNEAYARARGTTADQLIDENIWEFIPDADRSNVRAMLSGLTPEQPEVRVENRFETVEGERWTLWTNRALRFDASGYPTEIQSSGIDITDRKRAEQDLRESEERYRFIVENTSDGIWWIELTEPMPISLPEDEQVAWYYNHAVIRQGNLGLARMYGYNSVEEILGLPLRVLMPQENPLNIDMLRQFIRSGYRLVDTETRERSRDGHELIFLNNMIGIVEDGMLKGEWGTNRDITERKRAEEALRESEERYRGIVNQTLAGIAETDLTGKFIMVNDRYCEITGYSRRELLDGKMRMQDVTYPDDLSKNMEQFARLASNGTSFEIEKRYVRPDGGTVWVHNSVSAIVGPDGKPHTAVAAVIDVTERIRAEETLRRNEELFSTLVESAPFGVYFIDSEFRLRAINKGSEAVFRGIDPLIGRDFAEILRLLWQEPFATEAIENFRHTLQTGESFISPPTIEPRANIDEIQSYDWQIHRITMPDGTYGVVCYFYDLSEQKRMEAKVRVSESLYRAIARNIPDGGVYVVDKDFRYLVAEGPVTEAFGLTREMLEGRTVTEAFPDERGARMEERLRRTFAGEIVSFETQFGGRVYWTQQAPLHESLGQVIILTLDITERKQAEEALRQSEERFARFMRRLPGLAWIKDMEGRYVYANAAAERAFNTPREILYGRTDEDIFPPEVAAQFKLNDDQALTDEKGIQVIETFKHIDGVVHHSLVSKFPIPGPDGNTTMIGGTAFDITERLQAEEALRESEERFRAILRQATAGIVRKDAEGKLIFVNEAFCTMLGRTEAELLGKTMWDFMHEDDIAENKRSFQRLMLEGIPFKLERRLLRADGSMIWVDASVSPIMDANGKPQSAVTVEVDITGRKQAEEALQQLNLQLEERILSRTAKLRAVNEALREEITERQRVEGALRKSEAAARENEEKLSTLFELLPVGISFLNSDGQIIQMNSALTNILRLSKEQLSDQTYKGRTYIRANGTLMPIHEFASQRAFAEGKTVYNVETGIVMEDGEVIWTSVSAAPVAVADVGAVVVTADITESKRAERALQESRERLQTLSQRLVEVQEDERRAIARELHDRVGQTLAALNINLIIISGQLGGKVDEQISTRLNDSMKLVAETISLVRDVMSDLRPSVLDDYGLEAAIESYLSQFRSRYEVGIKFEKPDQPLPRLGPSIEMTFLRIAQEALMNIAKHAQASQVTLSLQRDENNVCLTVQDNGLGIISWQEANRPGSHGLTIMRERAEAFGGSLKVSSTPGKGTMVEVKIPIETNAPSPAEKENSQ